MFKVILFVLRERRNVRRYKRSPWVELKPYEQTKMYLFMTQWLRWIDSGAGKHPIFDTRDGMCWLWMSWGRYYNVSLKGCMYTLLEASFSNPAYPFGGRARYYRDAANYSMHLNPQRVKWVKNMVKVYEEGVVFEEEGRS